MNPVSKALPQQYGATVLTTEGSGNPEARWNNKGKTSRVKQADPTELIVAAPSSTDLTRSNLSDYVSNCQSLRNLVKPPKYSHGSLPPETLISEAEERLLSIKELDLMHQHMSQQTEVAIGGKNFKLEKLPEDAPLFYQFYCLDDKAFIDKKSIRIFKKNCAVEKSRPVIILMHSSLINKKVGRQIKKLVNNKNIFSVDMKELLPKLQINGIRITEKKDKDGNFFLCIDPTDYYSQDSRRSSEYAWETKTLYDIMDAFQCIAMYHYDLICKLVGVETSSSGCMKVDWDTQFLKPTGELQCPEGIRTLVTDRVHKYTFFLSYNYLKHALRPEMGLVAVTRPRHPVMAEALTMKRCIYKSFCNAVDNLFHQPHLNSKSNLEEFTLVPDKCKLLNLIYTSEPRCSIAERINPYEPLRLYFFTTTSWLQKIAFPLEKVKADQSRAWGICSWKNAGSASSQKENQRGKGIFKCLSV